MHLAAVLRDADHPHIACHFPRTRHDYPAKIAQAMNALQPLVRPPAETIIYDANSVQVQIFALYSLLIEKQHKASFCKFQTLHVNKLACI